MLHTLVCDLLGIEFPIIQAGMGPFTSAELVAAVSNAGALGSLGAGARTLDSFKEELAKIKHLTERPFAINHTLSPSLPNPEAFSLSIRAKPRLISFALGNPKDYIQQVHDAGILVMHQVATVQQAYQAAEAGVDIIIAQGTESGGFSGSISGLVLIPQVVDAVSPIPVVAAGGIADGRGLAAALVLGAQGVNVGTRFLASTEAPIDDSWKQAILAAESQDAVKVEFWNDIYPPGEQAYYTIPRTLSSPFIKKWENQKNKVKQEASQLNNEIISAIQQGKFGDLFPFTGQSAGQIKEILPAEEIVRKLVNEAEAALKRISQLPK
jgi:enoyl-[acyl-carrier protein] reductase II